MTCRALDRPVLEGLISNSIAAVRVPAFMPEDDRRRALSRIRGEDFGWYLDHQIAKIGVNQFSHNANEREKRAYFDGVSAAERARDRIFSGCRHPVQAVIDACAAAWDGPVQVAVEPPTGRPYFAGVVRLIESLMLHVDWGPVDGPGWAIEDVTAQLTWNVYLQVAESGGATRVHRRFWQPDDQERYKTGDYEDHASYGFAPELIEDAESVAIRPEAGDLILFNSRNYHRVEPSHGERRRITVTSFMGLLEPRRALVLWS